MILATLNKAYNQSPLVDRTSHARLVLLLRLGPRMFVHAGLRVLR